jgi:hypothetical protein
MEPLTGYRVDSLLERAASRTILVVGDLMLDEYLFGVTERISPEAPVQVVDVRREETRLGGAGNVVNNLRAYGVGVRVASVIGVIAGAFLASFRARECRWEAFDDQREMRRHITGGALMGVGGVLAGGCTIGQGLAAGSAFALSMPIALVAMMAGARLGIAILVGEMHDILARFRR